MSERSVLGYDLGMKPKLLKMSFTSSGASLIFNQPISEILERLPEYYQITTFKSKHRLRFHNVYSPDEALSELFWFLGKNEIDLEDYEVTYSNHLLKIRGNKKTNWKFNNVSKIRNKFKNLKTSKIYP